MIILQLTVIFISTAGIWFFSHILSKGSNSIGKHYNIAPNIRGATIDAVASSFPEFCTVVFALYAGSFEAGIGAIAGSALYNILIIPAVCAFISGPFIIDNRVIYRDGILYTVIVGLLVTVIWLGPQHQMNEGLFHLLPQWIGFVGVIIYLLYVAFMVLQSGSSGERQIKQNDITKRESSVNKMYAYVLIGISGICLMTHYLVDSSLIMFRSFGLSDTIAGVTVLAAATSLPDTFLSILSVKKGDYAAAVSNAFGSNVFDILICLGLPILLTNGVMLNWESNWPILLSLLGSTIVCVIFMMTSWVLTRIEALILVLLYILFIFSALYGFI